EPSLCMDKLRILMTTKSLSAIPQALRGSVIHYPRDLMEVTTGNRNDGPQRAALHFVLSLQSGEMPKGAEAQQDFLYSTSSGDADKAVQSRQTGERYKELVEIFTKESTLLEMDADTAFTYAKAKYHSTFGGIIAFRAEWFKQTGKLAEMESSEEGAEAAMEALSSVRGELEKRSNKITSSGDSEEIFQLVTKFVALLKREMPNAKFNGQDVHVWVAHYCANLKEEVPSGLRSIQKTAQFLGSSYQSLGLKRLKIGQGGVMYTVQSG
ncbi:hypothetical protein LCGC14_2692060, partial [marine sediment metagenome]